MGFWDGVKSVAKNTKCFLGFHGGEYKQKEGKPKCYLGKTCPDCGKDVEMEKHSFGDWKYLEDGKCRAKRRCVTCNYEENSTRHQFRWDHKDSNCRMIEICTRCGEIKKGLTVHSWINSDGKGKKICKDCGCNG